MEGHELGNLGGAYRQLGQVELAIEYYEQALEIEREIGNQSAEGLWLDSLGSAFARLGQMEKACEFWRQALKIYEAIKSPDAERVRGWLRENCGEL